MSGETNGVSPVPTDGASFVEEQETSSATTHSERTPDMPPKRRAKRGWIVAGVIVVVVVVAGIGAWVWHEQPGFCNAICHSPMDKYVESYSTTDPGLGVKAHAEAGESCLSCHEANMTTQVTELMAWTSDNYPMGEDGMLATGKEFANEEFCARSGCHDMQEVVANTWGFEGNAEKYNPHASHQDNVLECGDCHKIHETSELYCGKCHSLNLPEGWEATNE